MYRILIIEDDQRVADLLKRGLEEFGYLPAVAFNGEMGLRMFRSINPDLVIQDIVLPKTDCFGVAKEIKAQHPHIQFRIRLYHRNPD